MIFQYIYKPLLNFIYDKILKKIDDKYRNFIIFAGFVYIIFAMFLCMYRKSIIIFRNSGITILTISIVTAIIIIFSVNKKLEYIKWDKKIYFPFILTGILILFAWIRNDLANSYLIFAIYILFLFIALYFVWGNRSDYDTLFSLIANAYICYCVAVLLWCILKYPYPGEEWQHTTGYSIMGMNPNGFAKLLMPGSAAALYLVVYYRNRKFNIIYALIFGGISYVIYLSECRAGIIAIIITFLIGVFIIIREYKCNILKIFLRIITMIVGITIMFLILNFASPWISIPFNANENVPVETQEEIADKENTKVQANEESNKPVINSVSYTLNTGHKIIEKSEMLSKLDIIMSGRVSIWSAYISEMSLGGNNGTLFMAPHNQYIQLSYYTGVVTGLLWILLHIVIIISSFMYFIKREKLYFGFTLLVSIIYFIITMLDDGMFPFERSFAYMFFVAIAPMFIKKHENIS